jgi:hypothetical protein
VEPPNVSQAMAIKRKPLRRHFLSSSECFSATAVATPLWVKYEGEAHTPKNGKLESFGTLENSELDCRGQTSLHLSALGVIGKVLKCRCSKWPLREPFGHLQPKLWAKEGPGVKLTVWLPTSKSRESTCSWRAFRECNMALEKSLRGLQVWFRPRSDRRSGRGATKSQSPKSPNRGSKWKLHWGNNF